MSQDAHGNGKLYGETRNAIEVDCVDCHGTIEQRATLTTSGTAAPDGGTRLELLRTPWGERRFYWKDGSLFQRSMLEKDQQWEVVQVLDSITPGNAHYNEKSRLAKTIQKDGNTWGDARVRAGEAGASEQPHDVLHLSQLMGADLLRLPSFDDRQPAHAHAAQRRHHDAQLDVVQLPGAARRCLQAGHRWHGHGTSGRAGALCLRRPGELAERRPRLDLLPAADHLRGGLQRTGVQYLRSAYGPGEGDEELHRLPCRAQSGDNNAWMSQLLLQGTNFMNFMGRYIYVATGSKGYEAVAVTEHDEPPAVIGSDLQKLAYPDDYNEHIKNKRELKETYGHAGSESIAATRFSMSRPAANTSMPPWDKRRLPRLRHRQPRRQGHLAADDNRSCFAAGASVSMCRQSTRWRSPRPPRWESIRLRTQHPENEEQTINLFYGFLYVADREEGLIVIGNPNLKGKSGRAWVLCWMATVPTIS